MPINFEEKERAGISVIIPCYCCANTIERAVYSVLNQTLLPSEIIVVDDASTDATIDVLRSLEKKFPELIKVVVFSKNRGVADARNSAWDMATQPYVAFLDSDDTWHSRKVELQYGYMLRHPQVMMTGHGHVRLSEETEWHVPDIFSMERVGKFSLLISNRFITPSVMVKRDVPFRFLSGRRHMEDHLLWCQIICAGNLVWRLPVKLAAIYKSPYGESGLSGQMNLMSQGERDNINFLLKTGYVGNVMAGLLHAIVGVKRIRRHFIIEIRRLIVRLRGDVAGNA